MVYIYEVDSITLDPNTLYINNPFMITVTFKKIKLTWGKAIIYKWKHFKNQIWRT